MSIRAEGSIDLTSYFTQSEVTDIEDSAAEKAEESIADSITSIREDLRDKADIGSSNISVLSDAFSMMFGESEDSIIIKVPDSDYETHITNNQIAFYYQNNPVAYISADLLVIPKSVTLKEMQVGNNKWSWRIKENDYSLQLKWLG